MGQVLGATAGIVARDANALGAVGLRDPSSGSTIATCTLVDLPQGIHSIHLHETRDRQSVDLSSAGGHISGYREPWCPDRRWPMSGRHAQPDGKGKRHR